MWLPIGVATLSLGSWRRGCPGCTTGFTFGDGGMANPSLGVRAPPGREPGIAGRRSGAGEFIIGTLLGVKMGADAWAGVDVLEGWREVS